MSRSWTADGRRRPMYVRRNHAFGMVSFHRHDSVAWEERILIVARYTYWFCDPMRRHALAIAFEIGGLASTLFCARATTTTTTTTTTTAKLVITNCNDNDKNHATHFTCEDDSQFMPPRSARAHRINYGTRIRMSTQFCHFQAPDNASAQRQMLLRGGEPLVCHARLLRLLIKFGQISEYMYLHARCV